MFYFSWVLRVIMMFEAFGFMQERILQCRNVSQLPSGGIALAVLDPLSLNHSIFCLVGFLTEC